MSESDHAPDPVDVHVGERIRALRHVLQISQAELGDRIGVSFQQIQKYERGTNRVSASTLVHIAKALRVEPGELLPQIGKFGRSAPINDAYKVLNRSEGVQMMRALSRMPVWAYRMVVAQVLTLDHRYVHVCRTDPDKANRA